MGNSDLKKKKKQQQKSRAVMLQPCRNNKRLDEKRCPCQTLGLLSITSPVVI